MTLFLIPARAGSKRLPGKNKRLFCGLPLWMWSVATAHRVGSKRDNCIVSSDDPDIYDAPFGACRPDELCRDETTSQEVVEFYWRMFPDEHSICLLQPTSPTRPDSLVRQLIAHGGQARSVTNGVPNGQCYVYRKGATGWTDIETEKGFDIDVLADFEEAEKHMLRRFQ
jgi:CMP-N-acetylneuraminic acid synthetase